METLIKPQFLNVRDEKKTSSFELKINWENAETNRFGIVPMLLVVVACMGGLAVGFGARENEWEIALATLPTMVTLTAILSVAPMRFTVWSSIITLIIHACILIF